MLAMGITLTHENTFAKEFRIYEIWLMINTAYFIISIVQSLEHRKVIFAFMTVQIYYVVVIHYTYGMLNPQFYMGFAIYVSVFPIITVGVAKLIRDLLRLLQENKDLVDTIQIILKKFPEAVLITSQNEQSNESSLVFANNKAKPKFT